MRIAILARRWTWIFDFFSNFCKKVSGGRAPGAEGPALPGRQAVMAHEPAFLPDILENPEDDTSRLVYADWLEEHDQPERAEFIRGQIRLARTPVGAPGRN